MGVTNVRVQTDVFHANRSRAIVTRMRQIEAAVPSVMTNCSVPTKKYRVYTTQADNDGFIIAWSANVCMEKLIVGLKIVLRS